MNDNRQSDNSVGGAMWTVCSNNSKYTSSRLGFTNRESITYCWTATARLHGSRQETDEGISEGNYGHFQTTNLCGTVDPDNYCRITTCIAICGTA